LFVIRIASVFRVRHVRVALWRDHYDFGCFATDLRADLAEFDARVGWKYASRAAGQVPAGRTRSCQTERGSGVQVISVR
jgi:hypothetical protein